MGMLCVAGCSVWHVEQIYGEPFEHSLIGRALSAGEGVLHVYIHGDGAAFDQFGLGSADPTPLKPTVLSLMSKDPASSILLGRPCYFRSRDDSLCRPHWWTNARYSEEVVTSLVKALKTFAGSRPIVLIGFSGGGTLAMLMAPRLSNVHSIVTIAANLDIEAWAAWHGFTPLRQSLNPFRRLERTMSLPQVHYFGVEDEIVPAELVKRWRDRLPANSVYLIPHQTHACCWAELWPDLLKRAAMPKS